MTLSSGNLDSLIGTKLSVQSLADLSLESGTAANGSIVSVTARTGLAPYAAADSLQVTSVNDAANTIVVTASVSNTGGYSYGGGASSVPYSFTVVGIDGKDLLLAANGAAAVTALPASTVAADIQNGTSGNLAGDLFVLATDGSNVGAGVVAPMDLTFGPLTTPSESVAQILGSTPSSAVSISDSAANVQANLDALQSLAAGGKIGGITLTDQGTPTLTVTAAQLTADSGALGDISGTYALTVTGATVSNAASLAAMAHVGTVEITDSAADLLSGMASLNSLVSGGHALSITLTDSGTPNLSLTPTQLAADSAVLKAIASDYTLAIDGSASNLTVNGIAGRGTVVDFTGPAANYTITPSGDGVSFTVANGGSVDHLSNITALHFSDGTDFVAQAPSTTSVTSGNVTELYSAVLARTPDVPGLAFYQAEIASNPSLTLNQLAQNFLQSPEYVNNSAHNYAQTAAGDAQFITDTYNNLLHRAPETGAVSFYQNVINQFTAGLTPGTAAFAAAELAGHAQVLVNFAASTEFLGDVQITAQHPADAQHFLILI